MRPRLSVFSFILSFEDVILRESCPRFWANPSGRDAPLGDRCKMSISCPTRVERTGRHVVADVSTRQPHVVRAVGDRKCSRAVEPLQPGVSLRFLGVGEYSVPYYRLKPPFAVVQGEPLTEQRALQRLLRLRLPLPRGLENVTVCDEPLTDTWMRPEISYSLLWKSPTYLFGLTIDSWPVW